MAEHEKADEKCRGPRWEELRLKAKDDPKLARRLEAMERVMKENEEVLRRLAQS